MPRQSNKRERLVNSAKELLLQKGYSETTLADIAQSAEVPLGNVYYYFKTKKEIGLAVIKQHLETLTRCFNEWESLGSPMEKLKALATEGYQSVDNTISFGCAIGSLCQELCKSKSELSDSARELMNKMIDWVEAQFAQTDSQNPRELALKFVAHLQGIALLSNTFKDKEMFIEQQKTLDSWLKDAS